MVFPAFPPLLFFIEAQGGWQGRNCYSQYTDGATKADPRPLTGQYWSQRHTDWTHLHGAGGLRGISEAEKKDLESDMYSNFSLMRAVGSQANHRNSLGLSYESKKQG